AAVRAAQGGSRIDVAWPPTLTTSGSAIRDGDIINLWRDPETDEYGLKRWDHPDGRSDYWGYIGDELKPDPIKDHGTMVALFGENEKAEHDTAARRNAHALSLDSALPEHAILLLSKGSHGQGTGGLGERTGGQTQFPSGGARPTSVAG